MCGFLGYERSVSLNEPSEFAHLLEHRGPDALGYYKDENISFVHNRLSIIDLNTKANQPFYFDDLVLTYNGEIYNYKEIRSELINKGYSFQTNSDTEVIIKSFHYWGINSVERFIGMFAYCIYNKNTKEICLVRDRMGVKPLFYSLSKGLSFGSESKIFKSLGLELTIDPNGLYQYFRYGFTQNSTTIFNEVHKLLPGSYLIYSISSRQITKGAYWSVPDPTEKPLNKISEIEITEQLEELLQNAFQYRLVADVPIGILLSGGIDSSLLTALLQNNSSNKIKTFTIGFDHPDFDESKYARQVANHLGTDHTELILTQNRAKDLFRNFYDIYDEPFADTSGIPTALVTQLAKENNVKVILSADGGDELFGGYKHYQKAIRLSRKISFLKTITTKYFLNLFEKFFTQNSITKIKAFNIEHKILALTELINSKNNMQFFESYIANQTEIEIKRLLMTIPSLKETSFTSNKNRLLDDMMLWDTINYLPNDLLVKVDRATMHYGMEAREPMIDHRIVEFSRSIPANLKTNKKILRNILGKYLPPDLINRPKQGFSIPIFQWFKDDIDSLFSEFLDEGSVKNIPCLNKEEVQKEITKYMHFKKNNKQYNMEKMWRILSFVMWYKKWISPK